MNTICKASPSRTAASTVQDADTLAGITYNGRQFGFREFRYDKLADARDYAARVRQRPDMAVPAEGPTTLPPWQGPSPGQEATMLRLGIGFDGQQYLVGKFRYDHFLDAARYVLDYALPVPAADGPWSSPLTSQERHVEWLLDSALEATFPASDPIAALARDASCGR